MIYIILLGVFVALWADFKQDQIPVAIPGDKVAKIPCSIPGICKFEYENIMDCNVAYKYLGGNSYCNEGCIGLYTCVKSCHESAISKNLEVDHNKCNGCGICVELCPVGLVVLAPESEEVFVGCRTSLETDEVKESCGNGCLKCYICLDVCSQRAISVDKNKMPVIDHSKCNSCCQCVKKCPAVIIKMAVVKI